MIIKKDISIGSLYVQETDIGLYVDFAPKGANSIIPIVSISDRGDHLLLLADDIDGNTRELVYPAEKARRQAM